MLTSSYNKQYVFQKILMYWSGYNQEDKLFVLRKYRDDIDWEVMSWKKDIFLNENVLRQFRDYIVWENIDKTLYSLDFIREFAKDFNLKNVKDIEI